LFIKYTKYEVDMNIKLTQKHIGNRIASLRKLKGLSQEDLAKSIGISRPSLAQIELGNRSIDILELQKFSQVLAFSLDDFMAIDFTAKMEIAARMKAFTHENTVLTSMQISYHKQDNQFRSPTCCRHMA